MPFGKHKGKTLRDILLDDPRYLDWLSGSEISYRSLRAAVADMCKKYASEIEAAMGD